MARLSQLFLIIVLLSGIIALKRNSDEERQIQEGKKICQDKYGESFYYDNEIHRCCPCSPCDGYLWTVNAQCPRDGVYCDALHSGLCSSLTADKPEITTSPTTKFTDSVTKNKTQLTPTHTPSDISTSPGNGKVVKDDNETLLKIVIPLMAAACIILICICVCCMKNNRSFVESLKGKIFHSSFSVGKQSKSNPEYQKQQSQESQESGQILLCEQSLADNYAPSPGCPSTSGSYSVSEDGPPEMVDCQHVGHLYDSSVSGVGSLDPHSLSSDSRFSNTTSGGVAALQTRRPIEQRAQDAPLFDPGKVVIANAYGNGSVRTGDIHVHVHHPGANANHPMNMVNQQFVGSQFPYNPIPVAGRTSRRDENIRRTIDRQSSEYSSTASAPVENDTNAHLIDPKWNDSIARQDQFEALNQCQSDCYSQSGPVQHSSTTQHKVCSNRSQYTSMSSHVSQPQGDLEGNRRCATQAEAPSQD